MASKREWTITADFFVEESFSSVQFSSVQSLSRVRLFATPWIVARQASLSITISRSSLRLTSIESVMPSSHLILCRPLLLLPLIPPSIRVFSSESTLLMRWPKYRSFSFSIIPSKEIPGLTSFRMDWLDLFAGILKTEFWSWSLDYRDEKRGTEECSQWDMKHKQSAQFCISRVWDAKAVILEV